MIRGKPTLYDILGVDSSASDREIRAAFRRLAQENHPDRFSGAAREQAEKSFQSITEAFNVLSRPEGRENYDLEISQGQSAAMDPSDIARKVAAKGAQAYRDGNATEAMDFLRTAVNHDENCSRAHYFLGIILSRLKGREREGLRHMEKATELEPHNAAIKAEAAALFLAAGMRTRAARFADQALELDPTNTKASETLAQLGDESKPQSGGFLGRLRRKG